jgi:adenosylmethionine-8-amino-7-oxononanoate aminotransferase
MWLLRRMRVWRRKAKALPMSLCVLPLIWNVLQQREGKIAAVIIEPLVQCATGMAMHDPVYLRRLRELCDQYQVHLIADEIAVGCGRTGTFFACESAQIWPDFYVRRKASAAVICP